LTKSGQENGNIPDGELKISENGVKAHYPWPTESLPSNSAGAKQQPLPEQPLIDPIRAKEVERGTGKPTPKDHGWFDLTKPGTPAFAKQDWKQSVETIFRLERLPPNTKPAQIWRTFSKYGTVEVIHIFSKYPNSSTLNARLIFK
jgi:hypothetical protein